MPSCLVELGPVNVHSMRPMAEVLAAEGFTYGRKGGQRPSGEGDALLLQNLHALEHLCIVHHIVWQLCTQQPRQCAASELPCRQSSPLVADCVVTLTVSQIITIRDLGRQLQATEEAAEYTPPATSTVTHLSRRTLGSARSKAELRNTAGHGWMAQII